MATTGKSVVEVYDMSGALKSRVEVRNGQPVDLSGLRAGIYVAKAKVGDRTATVRFVR